MAAIYRRSSPSCVVTTHISSSEIRSVRVCVCVCVCVCMVCICACMFTCVCVCVYARKCVYIRVNVYVRESVLKNSTTIHTHAYTYTHTHTHTHTHTYTHTHTHRFMKLVIGFQLFFMPFVLLQYPPLQHPLLLQYLLLF